MDDPSGGPWDFDTAIARNRAARDAQEKVSQDVRRAWWEAADAERDYRRALALAIVRKHDEDGVAWSAAEALAKGDPQVSECKHAWDLAEGVKEATTHAAFKASADRRATDAFTEWSMRRELAEGYGRTPVGDGPIFGAAGRAR